MTIWGLTGVRLFNMVNKIIIYTPLTEKEATPVAESCAVASDK